MAGLATRLDPREAEPEAVVQGSKRRSERSFVLTAPRFPWRNPYCERVIGTLRRDCLNHVIVLGEQHLRRILRKYLEYYHGSRTHLALDKDAPESRERESTDDGKVIALPMVGGLHHRYTRRAA